MTILVYETDEIHLRNAVFHKTRDILVNRRSVSEGDVRVLYLSQQIWSCVLLELCRVRYCTFNTQKNRE